MNILLVMSLLCARAMAYGWGEPEHDGSWKGEGLAESQDHGQWSDDHKAWPAAAPHYAPQHHWAPAPLGHDGRVVDTPEVAHAKAAHLAELEKARAHAPADTHWDEPKWAPAPAHWAPAPAPAHWAPAPHAHEPKWTGPPAHIELTHDGKNLKDTPEVAHARAAHLAALAAASSKSHAPAYYHGLW